MSFLLLAGAGISTRLPAGLAQTQTGSTEKPSVSGPPKAPGSSDYLPDTAVLARVEDRTITAGEFVERFFGSYAEHRPRPDSAGRAEFLERLVDKEVIARVAKRAGRPLDFQDRGVLRAHTQRVLSNVLYRRAVVDSVTLEQEEIEGALVQARRLRLQRLDFRSREAADRARSRLVSGRGTWAPGEKVHGVVASDLGWRVRQEFAPPIGEALFTLRAGAISPVLAESSSYSIYRVAQEMPPARGARGSVIDGLRSAKVQARADRFVSGLRAAIGLTLDSANVRWAAARFPTKFGGGAPSEVVIDVSVPEIAPQDTARVLATSSGGRVTVGRLLEDYKATQDLQRPSLDSPDAIRRQIDVLLLEPTFEQVAIERGLDRDPMAISQIERRREELMVDHLYQDSIMSKVFIPPAERRKYYRDHQHRFITSPNAVFAVFQAASKEAADSIASRLRSGERAADIVREDSLAGRHRGVIHRLNQEDQGRQYHRLVFGELRPREVSVLGDGRTVLQLLERDSGRAVSFEEADAQIDEYLQSEAANELFAAFLERHKRRMRIESHPELVTRVRLVDPLDEVSR